MIENDAPGRFAKHVGAVSRMGKHVGNDLPGPEVFTANWPKADNGGKVDFGIVKHLCHPYQYIRHD